MTNLYPYFISLVLLLILFKRESLLLFLKVYSALLRLRKNLQKDCRTGIYKTDKQVANPAYHDSEKSWFR